MISRGFAGGGESSSARKAHLRSIRSVEITEVQAVSKIPRLDTSITFSDSDLEGCQHLHDDPLVIQPHYWKGQGLVIDVKGSNGRREILACSWQILHLLTRSVASLSIVG